MILDDVPPGPAAALMLLARRWRFVLGCTLAGAAVAAGYAMSRPRLYEASALLTTMSSQRQPAGLAGLPAGLFGGMTSGGGMQATPLFLARMAKLPSIMRAVGLSAMNKGAGGERIIDRQLHRRVTDTTDQVIASAMMAAVRVGLDEPTGLLTVAAANADSALARRLVEATVESASRAFIEATHAQAATIRTAQTQRIDSASHQLRSSESALREFSAANRFVAPFSTAAIEQMRLQRALELAQSVYNQSLIDRQALIARELDDSPALVVLDPVAPRLAMMSRDTKMYVLLGLVLSFLAAATWVLVQAALVRPVYRETPTQGASAMRATSRASE